MPGEAYVSGNSPWMGVGVSVEEMQLGMTGKRAGKKKVARTQGL